MKLARLQPKATHARPAGALAIVGALMLLRRLR